MKGIMKDYCLNDFILNMYDLSSCELEFPLKMNLLIAEKNKLIQEQDTKINQLDCLVENLMRQILRFRG